MTFLTKHIHHQDGTAPAVGAPVFFDCAGLTDPGPNRATNQDHFLIADVAGHVRLASTSLPGLASLADAAQPVQSPLLMVADGVSGQPGGAMASALTIRTVVAHVASLVASTEESAATPPITEVVSEALVEAGDALRSMGEVTPAARAPATTGTVALVEWPHLDLVHVGDSRCYLVRSGQLTQLTTDHTLAEEFRAIGASPAPALEHVLTHAVGGECQTSDHRRLELLRGDTILLCSDGLTDTLDEIALQAILWSRAPAEKRCRQLIRAAIEAKSHDNVTAIVVAVS